MRGLTPRQADVLRLRCHEGLTGKEIGHRLGVTASTVKNALSDAYERMGVTGEAQACYRLGRRDLDLIRRDPLALRPEAV